MNVTSRRLLAYGQRDWSKEKILEFVKWENKIRKIFPVCGLHRLQSHERYFTIPSRLDFNTRQKFSDLTKLEGIRKNMILKIIFE